MSHSKTTSLVLIIVVMTALAGAGGFSAARRMSQDAAPLTPSHQTLPPDATSEEDGHGGGQAKKNADTAAAPERGAEVSDLDRPVDEMWSASCEHKIPQYQCDECRYEIGAVKLDAALVGDNGLVATGFPEKRQGRHAEHSLPGEVQLDETRTVHVASPLTGLITRSFTTPGERVEAGAPLFEVDSPEVAEAKASYLKAVAGLDFARKAAEREALLFREKWRLRSRFRKLRPNGPGPRPMSPPPEAVSCAWGSSRRRSSAFRPRMGPPP